MKTYYCDSDIGSVLVGNKEMQFALPNIGGDGTTKLIVCSMSEYENKVSRPDDEFVTSINGKFNVFSYDCSNGDDEDVIATLEGRFGVYRNSWKVILERWD